MRVLSKITIAILTFIAVHAMAYGSGFVADPTAGLEEFGYETSVPIDGSAKILVRLVGIGLFGFPAVGILAAWRIIKGDQTGLSIMIVLGGIYLAIGIYVSTIARLRYDAGFFGGFGIAMLLMAGFLWKSLTEANDSNRPTD